MNIVTLAWRYLCARPLTTALNALMLALGFAAMAFVFSAQDQIERAFERDLAGIDAVIGAKGSPLQLILAGVFHLDVPPGNIALEEVDRLRQHPHVAQLIPLSLGDNLAGYRIVGTTHAYVDHYAAHIAQGRLWATPMEAVLGAQVAHATRLGIGEAFVGIHGLGAGGEAHDGTPYTVSGILAPCGCVLDRLVLTATESVWQVHDDLHGYDDMSPAEREALQTDREITLALVTYRTPLAAVTFPRYVNQATSMQAAAPASEITRLLAMLGAGTQVLQGFGLTLLLMAGLSVFVALWSAVREREADLAMLRMLGAPPKRVVGLLFVEAWCLALPAAAAGLVLSQLLLSVLGFWLPPGADSLLQAWRWTPTLGWIPIAAMVLATLAALLPAWRAWQLDVMTLLNRR
ncbi:ABC transporter permease [Tepidicella baoligensis]|uniref:ABC transporter permease n=1 Tax=Tepidicella baoligensis TaxID=2707016 RepID=UPI0015D98A1B|nr:ABC transporter permease [Tepidicella baoligensis]